MVLVRWAWLCPVSLAALGMMASILADNRLLANRSAGVLLLSIALVSVHDLLR